MDGNAFAQAVMTCLRVSLHQVREKRKLSLRQVGEAVGVSHTIVLDIERGTQELTLAWLIRLCVVYRIEAVVMLDEAEKEAKQALGKLLDYRQPAAGRRKPVIVDGFVVEDGDSEPAV